MSYSFQTQLRPGFTAPTTLQDIIDFPESLPELDALVGEAVFGCTQIHWVIDPVEFSYPLYYDFTLTYAGYSQISESTNLLLEIECYSDPELTYVPELLLALQQARIRYILTSLVPSPTQAAVTYQLTYWCDPAQELVILSGQNLAALLCKLLLIIVWEQGTVLTYAN